MVAIFYYYSFRQDSKCGDGICGLKEQANPNLCPKDCQGAGVDKSEFIFGVKLENIEQIKGISEAAFKIAGELKLDYVQVPIYPSRGVLASQTDWSEGQDYYYIFDLSKKYNIKVLPSFHSQEIKNPQEYADFVVAFLDELYDGQNIDYIEFQNEPVKDYNGKISARFKGTAADLAKTNAAAYEKTKSKYPDIKVGTAGFMTAAVTPSENETINRYYDEYFSAGPKFDFLSLHQYPKTSSYLQEKIPSKDIKEKYNFLSEYKIFQTYRQLLKDYGYSDKPILVTEGNVDTVFKEKNGAINAQWIDKEEAYILLAEKFVLALQNSEEAKVIGTMISGIDSVRNTALFNYDKNKGAYSLGPAFEFYKQLLMFLRQYPFYSKHIAGQVNSDNYWVEEFKDSNENRMWIIFAPFLFIAEPENPTTPRAVVTEESIKYPQQVSFEADGSGAVKITSLSGAQRLNAINGKIVFAINKEPLFVEEK